MKKFLSTAYSDTAFNLAALVLRLTFGLMVCILYGFDKMMHFSNLKIVFPDPLHIGHQWSLVLVIFAETLCGLLLVLGLFTRFAALVLVISFGRGRLSRPQRPCPGPFRTGLSLPGGFLYHPAGRTRQDQRRRHDGQINQLNLLIMSQKIDLLHTTLLIVAILAGYSALNFLFYLLSSALAYGGSTYYGRSSETLFYELLMCILYSASPAYPCKERPGSMPVCC